jgi:RimJ/RimL family protein N-acetyltransferase
MTAARLPHEVPAPGPAADFAAALAARLPAIETERLRLRAPRLGDAWAWIEIFCGPAGPHLGGPFDRETAFREFTSVVGLWLLRGHGLWAVEDRGGGLLGFVSIGFEPGDAEPELGFLLLPAAEGQGYAAEAAAAARAQGFGPMGLPSLVSYVDPANARSIRLCERLGARRDPAAEAALGEDCRVFRHSAPEVQR